MYAANWSWGSDRNSVGLSVFLSTRSSFLSLYTVTMLRMSTCLLKKLDDDDDDDDDGGGPHAGDTWRTPSASL